MPLHICSICGKTLSRSTKLSEHMRSHTGEKPFVCPTCGRSFARSYDLKKHKEVHSGVYRHKCAFEENGQHWGCGKGFHKKGDLTRHLRRHNAAQCRRADSETATRGSSGEAAVVTDVPAIKATLSSRDEHILPRDYMLVNEQALEQLTAQHPPMMTGALEHTPYQGLLDLSSLYEEATARRYDEPEPVPRPDGASVGPFDISEDDSPPSMETHPADTDLHCDACGLYFFFKTSSELEWVLFLLLADGALTVLGNTKLDII